MLVFDFGKNIVYRTGNFYFTKIWPEITIFSITGLESGRYLGVHKRQHLDILPNCHKVLSSEKKDKKAEI